MRFAREEMSFLHLFSFTTFQQIAPIATECSLQAPEYLQRWPRLTGFEPAEIPDVYLGSFGQTFLGKSAVFMELAQIIAEAAVFGCWLG